MQISKKELGQLIDAYADAKLSKNALLVSIMVQQIQQAIDSLYPEKPENGEEEQF